MKKYVYLGGPMEGMNQKQIDDWRWAVSKEWEMDGRTIVGITPNRCEPDEPYSQRGVKEIYHKNLMDSKRCDLLFAYLPSEMSEGRGNYGTTMECAWFMFMNKPIILVTDNPDISNHPLFAYGCGWIVKTLDEGVDIANQLLGVYE
jgi:hypothetical protein